jgi:hypothetical protein
MDRRLRPATLLAAVLSVSLLAACGEESNPRPPEEREPLADPPAYFGVTPCTCFEFVREDGIIDTGLGVAVEKVTDTYSGALEGQAVKYHVLRYRRGGQVQRTDFLRPTDPDLLLAGVNIGSQDWDKLLRLDPPVPYLRYPIDEQGQPVRLATTAQLVRAGEPQGEAEPLAFRADYTKATVIASVDGGQAAPMEAIRVLYDSVPWPDVTRFYVPATGLVKLENLKFGEDDTPVTWVLKGIRQLGGGCPWEDEDQIPPTEICGSY